ncbi:S-adenosyl-L-methionine-dependent methyltransferase [Schizopora paradoxa]|uniref:S-adenosyl-L-methionine-dependent methyltransferase n=1 Tax=Schizopora paradoxa TaxID=27342 RepID=A0A0H2S4J5_9AGAM|nr:S-adenosyl-L-methionine-dependent methyltransferase [Schizopora paradoxa]
MELDDDGGQDIYEVTSQASFNGDGAESDNSSAPSRYSYAPSRDGRSLFREIAGRKLNDTNDQYILPSDEGEHSRLDKQHIVHLLSVGRLYIPVEMVENALTELPDRRRAILDLGCGGGNWATSMALEFPHADVVGVDLAPTTTRPPPPNCRFEFDDFTLGLQHYYESFDVVHSRTVASGVKDFAWLVREAAKCVRPGGVLIMIEGNMELANSFKQPQEIAFGEGGPGQSWMARMCFEAYNTWKARGSSYGTAVKMEGMMLENEDLLADVQSDIKWIPIGPWARGTTPEDTRQLIHLGTLMRLNMKEFERSLVPLFLANGYAPELVQRFIQGADKEMDELLVHMYLKYHHCWARRIGEPGRYSPSTWVDEDEIVADQEPAEGGSYISFVVLAYKV